MDTNTINLNTLPGKVIKAKLNVMALSHKFHEATTNFINNPISFNNRTAVDFLMGELEVATYAFLDECAFSGTGDKDHSFGQKVFVRILVEDCMYRGILIFCDGIGSYEYTISSGDIVKDWEQVVVMAHEHGLEKSVATKLITQHLPGIKWVKNEDLGMNMLAYKKDGE
jgi:hypothetical protein